MSGWDSSYKTVSFNRRLHELSTQVDTLYLFGICNQSILTINPPLATHKHFLSVYTTACIEFYVLYMMCTVQCCIYTRQQKQPRYIHIVFSSEWTQAHNVTSKLFLFSFAFLTFIKKSLLNCLDITVLVDFECMCKMMIITTSTIVYHLFIY